MSAQPDVYVCLNVCILWYLSVCMSVYPCIICLYIPSYFPPCMYVYPRISLFVCLYTLEFVCLFVYHRISLLEYLYTLEFVCLFVYPLIWLLKCCVVAACLCGILIKAS